MLITSIAIVAVLSANPKGNKPPPRNDTMHSLLKDVTKSAEPINESSDGGQPDVSKLPFTPDSIKQVVASYQPQIQSCYEEHMAGKGDKAIEGTLKTTFIITGDGYVKNAKIDKKGSTLKEPTVHTCVVAVLSAMTFPKPPDGKDQPIEFPFNLKAIH